MTRRPEEVRYHGCKRGFRWYAQSSVRVFALISAICWRILSFLYVVQVTRNRIQSSLVQSPTKVQQRMQITVEAEHDDLPKQVAPLHNIDFPSIPAVHLPKYLLTTMTSGRLIDMPVPAEAGEDDPSRLEKAARDVSPRPAQPAYITMRPPHA